MNHYPTRVSQPGRPADRGEFLSRVERIQQAMRRDGLDVLVLTDHADVKYATGYSVDVLWSSPTRILVAVIPVEGDPSLLTPGFVAPEARAVSGWAVETYVSLAEAPIRQVVELIRAAVDGRPAGSAAPPRIGLERAGESRIGMTLATFEESTAAIAAALPGAASARGRARPSGAAAASR